MTEASSNLDERVMALAGIFQALAEVQRAARTGRPDPAASRICLESVLRVDAPSTESVFGSRAGLLPGLEILIAQLGRGPGRDMEIARYLAGLLALERKLVRRRALMARLGEGIVTVAAQADRIETDPGAVVAQLAELYKSTLSQVSPRIMVSGEPSHLSDPRTAEWIRALLLAAMRAAVLWRQLGGTRLGLTFSRERLVEGARALLASARDGSSPGSGPGVEHGAAR